MHAKHSHNKDENDQPANPSCRPKRCCGHRGAQHDEKYKAIFELPERAEERSERMEMHAEENQQEAFKQAQKALDSYNRLSEQILHAIINISGTNDVSK